MLTHCMLNRYTVYYVEWPKGEFFWQIYIVTLYNFYTINYTLILQTYDYNRVTCFSDGAHVLSSLLSPFCQIRSICSQTLWSVVYYLIMLCTQSTSNKYNALLLLLHTETTINVSPHTSLGQTSITHFCVWDYHFILLARKKIHFII